jgi:hypothetical protein
MSCGVIRAAVQMAENGETFKIDPSLLLLADEQRKKLIERRTRERHSHKISSLNRDIENDRTPEKDKIQEAYYR